MTTDQLTDGIEKFEDAPRYTGGGRLLPMEELEPQDQVARKPLIATSGEIDYRLYEILGWAMTHAPTREAYRRCTGEDAGAVLDRYQAWLAENVIGTGEGIDC